MLLLETLRTILSFSSSIYIYGTLCSKDNNLRVSVIDLRIIAVHSVAYTQSILTLTVIFVEDDAGAESSLELHALRLIFLILTVLFVGSFTIRNPEKKEI